MFNNCKTHSNRYEINSQQRFNLGSSFKAKFRFQDQFRKYASRSNATISASNKVMSPDPFIMIVSARFVHYWGHQYPSYSSEEVFLFCAPINSVFRGITDHLLVSGIVYHPVLLIRHFSEYALVKYFFFYEKKIYKFSMLLKCV